MKRLLVLFPILLTACGPQQPLTPAQAAQQRRCSMVYSQALMQPTLGGSSAAASSNALGALLAAGCD